MNVQPTNIPQHIYEDDGHAGCQDCKYPTRTCRRCGLPPDNRHHIGGRQPKEAG